MTLPAPPNQQQPSLPPSQERSSWLAREQQHWRNMPPLTVAVLLLSSALLLYVAPLLPFAAYTLWLWASHSYAWRDRWTSVWVWAKQGSWLVAFLIVVALLDGAHAWLVPDLIAAAQALWHAYLPGDLSLSPLDPYALVARTLLLLPLVPVLTLCYEWLDPRTCVQPQRILTPADLAEPKASTTASTTAPLMTKEAPPVRVKAASAPKAATTRQSKQRSKHPPPQQITIDGFLASDNKAQTARSSASSQKKKQPVSPEPSTETHPSDVKSINWDDVAE